MYTHWFTFTQNLYVSFKQLKIPEKLDRNQESQISNNAKKIKPKVNLKKKVYISIKKKHFEDCLREIVFSIYLIYKILTLKSFFP